MSTKHAAAENVVTSLVATLAVAVELVLGWLRTRFEAEQLGGYVLGDKIGQGGMGEVHRARHSKTGREVAIKFLSLDRADEDGRARFEREVRVTSALRSPNTVKVHADGTARDERPYYVMELVEGADLDQLVRRNGPLPARRVVHLLRQAAGALAEVHALGFVHRDVKPSNIAVCERDGVDDVVKLLDFGLVEELGSANGTRLVTGTPAYLAPEAIVAPETLDGRADLYSLGCVAYWLLTGTQVFDGNSIVEVCSHHLHTVPEAPSARGGQSIPADLESIVMRLLAKNPAARFANAEALRAALDALTLGDDEILDFAPETVDPNGVEAGCYDETVEVCKASGVFAKHVASANVSELAILRPFCA